MLCCFAQENKCLDCIGVKDEVRVVIFFPYIYVYIDVYTYAGANELLFTLMLIMNHVQGFRLSL